MRHGVVAVLGVLTLGVLALTGCGDGPVARASDSAVARMNALPLVDTINGHVPPGRPTLVATSTEALSASRDGVHVEVFRNVRMPGTRSPIHVHPYGGWTCVVRGQGTLFLEGAAPQTVHAGQCVDMPPMRAMSNLNQGKVPAVLLDNFVAPPGVHEWRVIERGQQHLGNQFGMSGHDAGVTP